MSPKGLSIHIGLNHVDPAAYNGWDGALSGCVNDATDLRAIAEQLGYVTTLLCDAEATADAVIAAIGQAASELEAGDILFLTYSGHGGQVADVNGDETDGQDETWVLYDRQLIDDELYALWNQFKPGVRIVMLSDSCHSGTMARMVAAYTELERVTRSGPAAQTGLVAQLAKLFPVRVPVSKPGMRVSPPRPPEPDRVKLMPSDVRAIVNERHKKENAARQYVAGSSERTRAAIGASVILISGCQDHELSLDGSANGLFTENLKAVWNEGTFSGSYKDFADAIVAEMPPNQQPNYYTVGTPNPAFEAQLPFQIGAPMAMKPSPAPSRPEETPAPEPAAEESGTNGSSSKPTLKRGDRGPYVKTLHERLVAWDFNLEVDKVDEVFGPRTESAVRSFQSVHELEPTGKVDGSTWDALR